VIMTNDRDYSGSILDGVDFGVGVESIHTLAKVILSRIPKEFADKMIHHENVMFILMNDSDGYRVEITDLGENPIATLYPNRDGSWDYRECE